MTKLEQKEKILIGLKFIGDFFKVASEIRLGDNINTYQIEFMRGLWEDLMHINQSKNEDLVEAVT